MKCISSLGIHTRCHIYLTLYWISFKFLLHCIALKHRTSVCSAWWHCFGWIAGSSARHFYFLKLQNNKIVKLQTCRIVKLQYNCIKTQNNDLMALLWMTCSKLLGTFQPASSSTSCCSAKITRTKLSIQFRSFCAAFCFDNIDWVLAKTSGTFWGRFLPKNPF